MSLQARPPSAGDPGGNDLKAHFNKRPASAGCNGAQKRRSTNIHNAVDTHGRTTCRNAGTVPRHLNTTMCPEPRKLKNMTTDGENSMWIFLPDELWIYILSMLSHEDLSHSAQVCHHFRRLANDKTLWEVIRIENSMCLNDNWLSSIGRHCPQSLTLYRCHDEVKSMTDNGLQELFRQCKDSLKELNITSCSGPKLNGDSVLFHASTYCVHLISVDISWTGATDNGIKALVQASRSLQCLSVNGCQMTDDALNSLVKKHGKRYSIYCYSLLALHIPGNRNIVEMAVCL
ncbi:lysine-specific demethylase 2B-like [Polyodon spathula]|uniref:lysine-specific demethylase 2B-like n=1 Tax=Polyodon spathula TaxID=7913 RepID=UPI001B7F6874|nr:lysine-specific demethylase 2B-like [Polyodon spathula]